jgi:CRISPR-associated protein Cmr5
VTRLHRTLDQRRAAHAWTAVEKLSPGAGGDYYAREAKRLPVRTLTSGLGHALAFLKAKPNDANDLLLRDLSDWVLRQRKLPEVPAGASDLVEAITKGDATFLQLATDEALAYLQWLSRFSEARFGGEEEGD